jgi:hypothetical protein
MKVIELKFEYDIDSSPIYLPLQANLENRNLVKSEKSDISELNFKELKHHWETSKKWDYREQPTVTLVDANIKNPEELCTCFEFDIPIFKTRALPRKMFDTPYDEHPVLKYFSSEHAFACYAGDIYDKDFSWFECPICVKWICAQNPSNGFLSQKFKYGDDYFCVKCWQEIVLDKGIDIGEMIENKALSADFFSVTDLKNANWKILNGYDSVLFGSGYSTFADTDTFFELLNTLRHNGIFNNQYVLIAINEMSWVGNGAYLSIYTKPIS